MKKTYLLILLIVLIFALIYFKQSIKVWFYKTSELDYKPIQIEFSSWIDTIHLNLYTLYTVTWVNTGGKVIQTKQWILMTNNNIHKQYYYFYSSKWWKENSNKFLEPIMLKEEQMIYEGESISAEKKFKEFYNMIVKIYGKENIKTKKPFIQDNWFLVLSAKWRLYGNAVLILSMIEGDDKIVKIYLTLMDKRLHHYAPEASPLIDNPDICNYFVCKKAFDSRYVF